jgi:Pectate lyase superfamily protein
MTGTQISDMTVDTSFPDDAYVPIISDSLNPLGNYKQLLTARINLLTGATLAAGNFGAFTGSIIADNSSAKTALQALETATEVIPTNLAASSGSALVGFLQAGAGAVARTMQSKERDIVSVKDFGAVGDGAANDTAAIQAAIDSNASEIFLPGGTYLCGNLSFNNDYQRIVGPGATITRNANAVTFTVSARGVQFHGVRFKGGAFTGDNVTVTGPESMFIGCDSVETPGRPLKFSSDGGNGLVLGGIYNTTDLTASGYDIELVDAVPGTSLYTKIIGVSTNAATGGVLINGQGTVRMSDCQIGKLTVSLGGGMFTGNRFNGAVSVESSSNQFDNNAYAGNVTFGDGAGGNIGQIGFGPTNMMQSGTTITINSDVVESSFHLGQLANVTLVINGNNNDIWHNELSYTPTLTGGGGPTLNNGTLQGKVVRSGRQWFANLEFVVGSLTTLGTSFNFTAPHKAKFNTQGVAILTDSGTGSYKGVADMASSSSTINVLAGTEPIGGILTPTAPFTWATGDTVKITISGQYIA